MATGNKVTLRKKGRKPITFSKGGLHTTTGTPADKTIPPAKMSDTLLHLPCPVGQVSDGYHTFDELYTHRVALFLALAASLGTAWRSLFHADGSMFEGWFIAGMTLSTGAITYHLPIAVWKAASFMHTLKHAPAWDGHTPADVVERLMLFAGLLDEDGIA